SARPVATQGEIGDVHAVLPANRTEQADYAGHVGIGGVKHVPADLCVEIDALDLDEARLAVGEAGAGNCARLLLGLDRELDIAVEHTRLVALDLGSEYAAFLLHDRRRYLV